MENNRFSVAVNRETKVLLDALVLLKGRPMEQVLHEAVLKMFGAVPESMPRNGGAETPTLSTPDASQTYRAGATLADRIPSAFTRIYPPLLSKTDPGILI